MTHVRYIDKTRDYYLSEGYATPYQWAHFETIPFTPLPKPLGECRVGLVTTSEMALRDAPVDADAGLRRDVYSLPSDVAVDRLVSRKAAYDRYATTLDDIDAHLPLTHLRAFAAERRIASVAPRFHVVYTEYSQAKTLTIDAPEILRRLQDDRVDVAVLTAI
jgi:glycine/sarcosine/betaine reductase selenoprotein B